MVVTQITELSKSRCKVYIDQEFAFVLYKGELRLYKVAEGKEIAQKDYEELTKVVLPRRAKLRAMNLLQKRAYTEKQLRDKLEEGGYPTEILEEAIEYVKSYHYVDDVQYAVDYITCYESRKSTKMLEIQLISKGISKENIRVAFMRWREQGGIQNEESMIRELLEKKNYDAECDIKEKNRIYGFLLRKGFSPDKIQEAMRAF
ncbi:MAG: regulatory protein RecX [Lachnospiraceae bacterium]|nr:regulatory protein RecX [Lachnospiraceae bacterium]